MRRLLASAAVIAVVFVAITLLALESREVVLLRTGDQPGPRQTRTWIADDGGVLLVEAANPARPFLRDIEKNPELELRRAGVTRRCRATPLPNPAGHERIRALLAQKYGWADCWVAILADTSRSVALRLECS